MSVFKKATGLLLLCVVISFVAQAQPATAAALFYKMRSRLNAVQDYIADVKMNIDIAFLKIPTLRGKLYFKSPDKMRLDRHGGISILPKKSLNLTLNNLMPTGNVTVIDAGSDIIAGRKVRVIKVVPESDNTDIVLTKIWIDEERLLALRTETTTRENGTVSIDLRFGKYASLALPDMVTFYVDVKEFKVPKGVTMDYDGGEEPIIKKEAGAKPKKGTIQITYLSYQINTGLSDKIFMEEKK